MMEVSGQARASSVTATATARMVAWTCPVLYHTTDACRLGIDTLATPVDWSRGMGGHHRFMNTIKGSFCLGIFCHYLS